MLEVIMAKDEEAELEFSVYNERKRQKRKKKCLYERDVTLQDFYDTEGKYRSLASKNGRLTSLKYSYDVGVRFA